MKDGVYHPAIVVCSNPLRVRLENNEELPLPRTSVLTRDDHEFHVCQVSPSPSPSHCVR